MRCAVCNTDNPDAAVACRSCGSPLAAEAAAASEQVLTIGTALPGGAFVVEGVLGQGGFGITYKSRDARRVRSQKGVTQKGALVRISELAEAKQRG